MATPMRMTITMSIEGVQVSPLNLVKLMHLCSVSLPVGAYSFSQGLEYAIDEGWLTDAVQIREWIETQLQLGLVHVELPVLNLAMAAVQANDVAALRRANRLLLACRESRELRLADCAMGEALARMMPTLGLSSLLVRRDEPTFIALFGQACAQWGMTASTACLGYAWSWLEGQVSAATKLLPMGQTQSQQMIAALQPLLPGAVDKALQVEAGDIGCCLPGMALSSALHETQYSRLFRS